MTETKPGVPMVRSVRRAVDILNAFASGRNRLTLSEVAAATNLDRNTARRLLNTLETVDFIRYDSRTHLFSLGTGILALHPAIDFASKLREMAAPILSRLAMHSGSTAFLWTYLKGQAFCVERVRGGESLYDIPWTRVGSRLPLNCGAGPRVILAHLPEGLRSAALAQAIGRTTARSRTDPGMLAADAAAIRERGWELALDDFVTGLGAVGAPVFFPSGEFAGSISITAASHRFGSGADRPPQLDLVLDAAAEIGFRLE